MNTNLYALFHIVNQSTDFLLILFRCGMQAIFCLGLASPCQVLMLMNTLLNIKVVRIFSSSCDVYLAKNGTFRTKTNCWFTNSVVNELVLTKIPFIVYELQASNEFKASSFWFHVTMMFHLLYLFNIVVGARLSFPWIIKNNAGKLIHRYSQAPAIYFHKRGRVSNSVGEGQRNFLMKYYQRKWHKTHSSV